MSVCSYQQFLEEGPYYVYEKAKSRQLFVLWCGKQLHSQKTREGWKDIFGMIATRYFQCKKPSNFQLCFHFLAKIRCNAPTTELYPKNRQFSIMDENTNSDNYYYICKKGRKVIHKHGICKICWKPLPETWSDAFWSFVTGKTVRGNSCERHMHGK